MKSFLLILIMLITFSSCNNKKINETTPITSDKESKPAFISQLKESWMNHMFKDYFSDFDSHRSLEVKNIKSQNLDKVHIVSITGDKDFSNLSKIIDSLENLEALELINVNLTNTKATNLFSSLTDKNHFKKILINNCNLKNLPKDICKIKRLETISLKRNYISALPDSIVNLEFLKVLDLYNNKPLRKLPDNFGNLKNLEFLELAGTSIKYLPTDIGSCSKLMYLAANNCKLTIIPESIGSCKLLRHINLGYNKIENFPESLGFLSKLTGLSLSNNLITTIPKSIGNLKRISLLSLGDNKIKSYPTSGYYFPRIATLELDNNQFKPDLKLLKKSKSLVVLRIGSENFNTIEIQKLKSQLPEIVILE